MKINVVSVNISEKKGTIKVPVEHIELTPNGVQGDAHAGKWHRQVSLLGTESFRKFEKVAGRPLKYGEFAENITTEGIILYETHPLDRFTIGNALLEVTQIGKKCHGDSCAIYREVGNCVMPKEGIFCRVLKPGIVKAGDEMTYQPKVFRIKVITLSDRAASGEYEDRSGPRAVQILEEYFAGLGWKAEIGRSVIPDEAALLRQEIDGAKNADIIITTGGTGIGPRDITVDTVKPMLDKEIPGIMEMIRQKYGSEKPNALLSRGIAGVKGMSLIYTLPGSVRAVEEYLSVITPTIRHSFYMLNGLDLH
ncbi:molybdenum cofactor synthesis domain-containing protein [Lentimicrobium sp.]|jgi:molybdenum cofactor synthesis domain-containing protein|uniref:molybdenum cofactor synthesis domain-containing protein n=1 Tax=Lentimicrobium sp. TaxID=2034841 RepID=UPI002B588036|nr:molybdenum cofactor synthesis domain-containing protein [Lentimicrobium sp.]HPF63336.1 molybdopterin-binding protein [Lentimicrobium sp.]HPJ62175.1 molybdopterin-binding protein [Lentimicrobium sp.]HRW68046.1 molybdopterin-binding protein [Lentimicrobium sp.]